MKARASSEKDRTKVCGADGLKTTQALKAKAMGEKKIGSGKLPKRLRRKLKMIKDDDPFIYPVF